jgi:NDP-sugar pyrophosphorylase family protein
VLAPVHNRPYLTYLLDWLAGAGLREVMLLTGHGAKQVQRAVGQSYRGLHVIHSPEPSPLGTGGALRWALPKFGSSTVLLLNGDSWCDVSLQAFHDFHERKRADVSLVLAEVPEVARFGRVQLTRSGRVTGFGEKDGTGGGFINAGVYLLERRLIEAIPAGWPIALERDLIPLWIDSGRKVCAFSGSRRFLDIGTPESYAEAEAFFQPHAYGH